MNKDKTNTNQVTSTKLKAISQFFGDLGWMVEGEAGKVVKLPSDTEILKAIKSAGTFYKDNAKGTPSTDLVSHRPREDARFSDVKEDDWQQGKYVLASKAGKVTISAGRVRYAKDFKVSKVAFLEWLKDYRAGAASQKAA